MITFHQLSKKPRQKKKKKIKSPGLMGCPQRRGVCLKVYTTTPKKPNSAIRKVAKIKLSTGKNYIVYIPGQGHQLQQHSVVLIRGGRTPDLPGVKYKMIRSKYDFVSGEKFQRIHKRSKFSVYKPIEVV